MSREPALTIGLTLAVAVACGASQAAAQSGTYPRMAAIDEYLMDRDDEIRLARSAAPDAISRDATILVLGPQGYETAVEGSNGFTCMVARGWLAGFDWPEFWNPRVRAPDCMNARAARFVVPVADLRSRMVMAGRSRAEVLAALEEAFTNGQLPPLEGGAMSYMMSREAYLTDEGDHNAAHVMFLAADVDAGDGSPPAAGSPVMSAPYWFFSPGTPSRAQGLPPVLVFLVGVAHWSDGTPAGSPGD